MSKKSNPIKTFALISIGIIAALAIAACSNNTDTANIGITHTRPLFTLGEATSISVIIMFDNYEEIPEVQLIAPGNIYLDMNNIRSRDGSNFIQYFLPSATPGDWQMTYKPLSNNEIRVFYVEYEEQIFIDHFHAQPAAHIGTDGVNEIGSVHAGHLQAFFKVSADSSWDVVYKLYAVFTAPDNSILSEILLDTGIGKTNEDFSKLINIQRLQDTGGFMLRLDVYVEHDYGITEQASWLDFRHTWLIFD